MTQTVDMTAEISALLEGLDGEVTTRSRVVDALLDLRNVAGGREDLRSNLDALLADIPGYTMVPNNWWRDALTTLRSMAEVPYLVD